MDPEENNSTTTLETAQNNLEAAEAAVITATADAVENLNEEIGEIRDTLEEIESEEEDEKEWKTRTNQSILTLEAAQLEAASVTAGLSATLAEVQATLAEIKLRLSAAPDAPENPPIEQTPPEQQTQPPSLPEASPPVAAEMTPTESADADAPENRTVRRYHLL